MKLEFPGGPVLNSLVLRKQGSYFTLDVDLE